MAIRSTGPYAVIIVESDSGMVEVFRQFCSPATICSFQTGPDVTKKTKYPEFKATVLEAGRFSVFEATETPRAARLYDRLCKDPEVETTPLGFPWTSVKRKRGDDHA